MIAIHGTTAGLRDRITSEGLVEPFPGRGIALCPLEHRAYAERAAEAACNVARHEQDGHEREAQGLLVTANVSGLIGMQVPAGPLDHVPAVLVQHVPPERILNMQTVAVGLPARHSIGDRLMRTGFACRHDGFGRRSWEIAQGWPCYLTPAPLPRVPSVRIPDLSR